MPYNNIIKQQIQMQGQHLPKATMNTFIKKQTNLTATKEFIEKMLIIAKEYIVVLSDKCNAVCEGMGKKTINVEHLELALIEFDLTQNLQQLRDVQKSLKEMNQQKKEENLRIEQRLAQDREQKQQKRRQEERAKKQVLIRQKFEQIQKKQGWEVLDCDYQNLQKQEVQKESTSTVQGYFQAIMTSKWQNLFGQLFEDTTQTLAYTQNTFLQSKIS